MSKTFREVIRDIKNGEVWVGENFNVHLNGSDLQLDSSDGSEIGECVTGIWINMQERFRLKRQQYTFTEAFAEYEKGVEIESLASGTKYVITSEGYKWDYISNGQFTGEWFYENEEEIEFTYSQIKGKWYINKEDK